MPAKTIRSALIHPGNLRRKSHLSPWDLESFIAQATLRISCSRAFHNMALNQHPIFPVYSLHIRPATGLGPLKARLSPKSRADSTLLPTKLRRQAKPPMYAKKKIMPAMGQSGSRWQRKGIQREKQQEENVRPCVAYPTRLARFQLALEMAKNRSRDCVGL